MAEISAVPVLSFPAILRNPGINARYTHLQATTPTVPSQKPVRGEQHEGKRWIRRKDNACFAGNPHIAPATKRDYLLPCPTPVPTFPEPLPAYLPRTAKIPSASLPLTDPASANAGRFSLSLKGMRRDLRRAGGRAEALVREVEDEMVEWVKNGGTVLMPDKPQSHVENNDQGTPVGITGTIVEISRTPLQLVWRIPDDPFARYVVHCCARYHDIVSFSKGSPSRLTYLLRPNVTRPDRRAISSLDTPPITDLEYNSTDIDSDFVSDRELADSDVEHDTGPLSQSTHHLSSINESSVPSSPHISARQVVLNRDMDDSWSILSGDADAESESGNELELEAQLASLTLSPHLPPKSPLRPSQDLELESSPISDISSQNNLLSSQSIALAGTGVLTPPRRRAWAGNALRSASSPSRSPVRSPRTRASRRRAGKRHTNATKGVRGSFYDFLYL